MLAEIDGLKPAELIAGFDRGVQRASRPKVTKVAHMRSNRDEHGRGRGGGQSESSRGGYETRVRDREKA